MKRHSFTYRALSLCFLTSVLMVDVGAAAMSAGKMLKLGREAMTRGDFDTAVELFSNYKAEKPDDEKIDALLEAARTSAVTRRLDLAKQAFDDLRFDEAEAWLVGAQGLAPNQTGSISLEDVRRERKTMATRLSRARELAAAGDLDDALQAFQRLKEYESVLPDLHEEMQSVQRRLSSETLQGVEALLASGKTAEAGKVIEKAQRQWKLNPGAAEARSQIDAIKAVKKLNAKIADALRNSDYSAAYGAAVRAMAIEPDNIRQQEVLEKVQQKWGESLYNKGTRAMLAGGQRNLEQAVQNLRDAETLQPGLPGLEEKQVEAGQALAEILYAQASTWTDDEEMLGHRLVYLLRVAEMVPDYPNIDVEVSDTLKALKARRQYFVSIKTTDLPGKEGDGFAEVLNQDVLSRLRESSIPDLNVVHREDLESKTQEQVYSQIFGGNFELDLKPANIQVVLKVLDKSATKRGYNKPMSRTSEYRAGTRMVENPEYRFAESEVRAARSAYQQAVQANQQAQQELQRQQAIASNPNATQWQKQAAALSSLGTAMGSGNVGAAERRVQDAESTLAITPMQIEEEIIKPYTYKEYNVSCEAKVKIAYQIVDNETALFKDAGTVEAEDSVSDTFTVGVQVEDTMGIYENPDDLDDPDIVLGAVKKTCSNELQDKLVDTFKNYAEKYYKQSKEAARIGDTPQTVERSIDYLYSVYSLDQEKAFESDSVVQEHLGHTFRQPMDVTEARRTLGADVRATSDAEPHHGVYINAVKEDGPAARSNLKAGDIVQAVDLIPVSNPHSITDYIQQLNPHQAPVLTVLRDGRKLHVPLFF